MNNGEGTYLEIVAEKLNNNTTLNNIGTVHTEINEDFLELSVGIKYRYIINDDGTVIFIGDGESSEICSNCNGKGTVRQTIGSGSGETTYEEVTCDICNGAGIIHHIQSISLDINQIELNWGEKATLKATKNPQNAIETIIWSSSNDNIVSVTNGEIKGDSSGTAVITARCGNQTATCNVTVKSDGYARDILDDASGPYINYSGYLCRLMYNNSNYGIQIITVNSYGTITIGGSTASSAFVSYNNAISTLNSSCSSYLRNPIGIDARCVGNVPNQKIREESYFTLEGYSFRDTDSNYTTDMNKLNSIGAAKSNNSYG